MYRNVINDLAAWYEENKRKILCVKGAYGVGKTWTINDFATAFFDEKVYIDCSKEEYSSITSSHESLDNALNEQYKELDFSKCLLIFDEVQYLDNCAQFFYEYAKIHRDYTICLIASSMEISEFEYTHPDVFKIIRMRPMSFEEYMIANKANPFIAAIENQKHTPLNNIEVQGILSLLREYMLVGGMPGIVNDFIKTKDYEMVRKAQNELIEKYNSIIKNSFNPAMYQRCRRIWRSIPKQLTRDNKKFMYRFVETNARSREYSEATQYLCNLGIARKLPRLSKAALPLEDYVDYKAFELFFIDHGLLRAAFNLPINETITLEDIYTEKNGAIAEQYIFQELSNKVGNLYYWTSGATARVPFVYEGDNTPVPVDIRFVENNKAQNIKTFRQKNPNTEIALKISFEQVALQNNSLNIPIYGLWNM